MQYIVGEEKVLHDLLRVLGWDWKLYWQWLSNKRKAYKLFNTSFSDTKAFIRKWPEEVVKPGCFFAGFDEEWTVENVRTKGMNQFIWILVSKVRMLLPYCYRKGPSIWYSFSWSVFRETNGERSARPSCFHCSVKFFQLKIFNIPKCYILEYLALNPTNMILITFFATLFSR